MKAASVDMSRMQGNWNIYWQSMPKYRERWNNFRKRAGWML